MCLSGIGWDMTVGSDIVSAWGAFLDNLAALQQVKIDRYVFHDLPSLITSVEIHGFCDASQKAYAAVCYVKASSKQGVAAKLITSKAKVAPLKLLSIPRLELMGCVLLVELIESVRKAFSRVIDITRTVCWTDSEICLHWIFGVDKQWKIWIENRVNKIRAAKCDNWRYVPSKLNPADIPTKNIDFVKKLTDEDLWWSGPPFILEDAENWPNMPEISFNDTEKELRRSAIKREEPSANLLITGDSCDNDISNVITVEEYSTILKLLKVTCYVFRFINNSRARVLSKEVIKGELRAAEITEAEKIWLKSEQRLIRIDSKYKQLQTSLDLFEENGVLKLKGRIAEASVGDSFKQPILLRSGSHFTTLVVREAHDTVKHGGTNATLNEVRSRFYICRGRKFVKGIVSRCVTCKQWQGKTANGPPPPNLPEFRLSCDFAFSSTGVDFAGPLYVKQIYDSSSCVYKAYILLFTCATTRNVHLELTPGMDSNSLILALRRFLSRRGYVKLFVSDNFSSFKSKESISFLQKARIEWQYILPMSPWWGGFYERMVRIVKSSLKKILGNARVTFEELSTILTEIEMTINSRPITYLYENNEIEALCPSHLMVGRRLQSNSRIEERNELAELTYSSFSKKLRYLESLLEMYWRRFNTDYLSELREQHIYNSRKTKKSNVIMKDDVVMIKDDEKQPRGQWKKGIVIRLITGKDGHVRGAVVKCMVSGKPSEYERPIQRLVPFEIIPDSTTQNSTEFQQTEIPTSTKDLDNSDAIHASNTDIKDVCSTPRPRRHAAIIGENERRRTNQV